MDMNLKLGELYFIREQDPLTREISDYVKIGLVKDNGGRTSESRLEEHQTGNPRDLIIHAVVTTSSIIAVETTMHGIYAPKRVNGEWFKLTNNELADAVETAKGLADEVAIFSDQIASSDALSKILSDGNAIEATPEMLTLYGLLNNSTLIVKEYEKLKKSLDSIMIHAINSGDDVGNLASKQVRNTKVFDELMFKSDFPEIYKNFVFVETTLNQRFIPVKPTQQPVLSLIDPVFYTFASEFKRELEQDLRDNQNLHSLNRILLSIYTRAVWDKELYTAQLKTLCGTSKEIIGICKWNREKKQTEKFDKKKFQENYPELFENYLSSAEIQATIIDRKRQYSEDQD